MKFISTPNISSDLYEEWNKMNQKEELELLANRTAASLAEFFMNLSQFKIRAGLKDVDNPFEVCTSMADKSGRIFRLVKHVERKDPKPSWRIELCQSLTGFLSYTLMLINKYNMINVLTQGVMNEMIGSVHQHAVIEENKDREHVGCRNDDVTITIPRSILPISEADKIELENTGKLKRDGANQ